MKKKLTHLFKLKPFFSPKIWGWEQWILSCHPNGLSTVELSSSSEISLRDILQSQETSSPSEFPILTKIIQANQNLSIQVHPDDVYAAAHENSMGKSECWYILAAEKNASLMINFKKKINRQNLSEMINDNTIESHINRVRVQSGDFIYIPAGTIHAIGKGIRLLEIQQSSDITYRVYDYNRGRELHIEKSLDTTDYSNSNRYQLQRDFKEFNCPYFKLEKIIIPPREKILLKVNELGFKTLTVIRGKVQISTKPISNQLKKYLVNLEREETCYTNTNCVVENLSRQAIEVIIVTA